MLSMRLGAEADPMRRCELEDGALPYDLKTTMMPFRPAEEGPSILNRSYSWNLKPVLSFSPRWIPTPPLTINRFTLYYDTTHPGQ